MAPTDADALERAIAMARLESPSRAQQIDDKLKDDPWLEVGKFAAYCCQSITLRLKPWETPPCWVSVAAIESVIARGDINSEYKAARLLEQMLAAGLSKYEPDPPAALRTKRANGNPT
jgi:hypothetical protein